MHGIAVVATLVVLLADGERAVAAPRRNPVRFEVDPASLAQVFFKVLSPHGSWMVSQELGLVWRPHRREVGEEFVPFATGGQWLRGPEGWQFESRYAWGGIVFRYGGWAQDFDGRWVWIPGERQAHRGRFADAPDPDWDPANDPRLRPPHVRKIAHPEGTEFAYPYGPQWGRTFPAGTEVRLPPGDVGSGEGQQVLVPSSGAGEPVIRLQHVPVVVPVRARE